MNLKAIGSRIKAAREKKGLTQEALSEIVDLSLPINLRLC